MIGGFTEIDDFMRAVSALKGHCCTGSSYLEGETALKLIWAEFLKNLEKQINEQHTIDKLSIFIKIAQNNLTNFADKIYVLYHDAEPCNADCRLPILDFIDQISTEVMRIVSSLQANFSDYFDFDAALPKWVIAHNKKAIPQQKRIVYMLEEKGINPELLQIINTYTKCLYVPDDFIINNWRQFFYLESLTNQLFLFAESPATEDDNLKLIKLLIGHNFNPLVFYEFMLEYLARTVSSEMPYEEQEMELLLLLKTIENIRLECKTGYSTDVQQILKSVCGLISRELVIVSKMKEVVVPYPINGANGKNSSYYFDVSTTIEELFFLMRIMMEVRFVKTKFKANLYSFVSRHIRTERTKTPSEQYMRNIFGPNREVPVRVIRKIRSWLMTMVHYIDTNFGSYLKIWFLGIETYSFFMEVICY